MTPVFRIVLALLLLTASSCRYEEPGAAPAPAADIGDSAAQTIAAPAGELRIVKLHPDRTPAGAGFNVQPNGESAIAVAAENAGGKAVIVMGGRSLPTIRAGRILTAYVPRDLYATAGAIEVQLVEEGRASEPAVFTVLERSQ